MNEPDRCVVSGSARNYLSKHPGPADVVLVVEVADSSLADDRELGARVYGPARLPVYWIVNLVDRQVEVYTSPGPGGYQSSRSSHPATRYRSWSTVSRSARSPLTTCYRDDPFSEQPSDDLGTKRPGRLLAGRERICRLFFSVIGHDVVDPDIAGTVDLHGDDNLLRAVGDLDNPLVAFPVVRGRWISGLLCPDVGGPMVGPLAASVNERGVEDGLGHFFGLDESTQLQAWRRTGAFHLLKPLGDREIS